MKRKRKNIILILLIIIMIVITYFTMDYAKNNSINLNNLSQDNIGNIPNMNNGDMNEPPEKPDDEIDNINESENDDGTLSENMQEPPEKPDNGYDNNQEMNIPNMNNSNKLDTKYYLLFAAESLILSLLIIYLLMSGFNKKSLKETFKSSDKVLILILLTIILTGILTYADGIITNKYFLNNLTNDSDMNNQNMQSNSVTYASAKEITEDTSIDSGSYSSTTSDENAILVSGDINVTLSNITVSKEGDSDGGDNTSFYGMNSAILAKGGANLTIKNITVETNATGANGVFSYGGSATTNNTSSDGTTITISDSKITTTKDNSGGIMTTGGGKMVASNLTINTSGTSSAAIRTDRGGGEVLVDGGTYTTTGPGSPSIYSTADITVSNATLVSKASEGIVIEGKNSVTLNNCDLTDTNSKLNGQSTTYKNIFLYQSMSGDAADGNSEFTAKNSKITTNKGDSFYITNTTAIINLTNNTIVNNDSTGNFLRAQSDSWGNSGSNGGDVTLVMDNQEATGSIVIDSVSTLDMTMKSSSTYEGTINSSNTAKSILLTLDSSSKIKLTGDSYVTSLSNSDSSNSNIDFNGYKLYVNGKAIN